MTGPLIYQRRDIVALPSTTSHARSIRWTALAKCSAQVIIKRWREHYNTIRPHSSLACRPPALQTFITNLIHRPPRRLIRCTIDYQYPTLVLVPIRLAGHQFQAV